ALPSNIPSRGESRPIRYVAAAGSSKGILGSGFDLKKHLMQEARKYLLSALRMAEGVVAEAAYPGSLRRTTFVEKRRRRKIERKMALVEPQSSSTRVE